jgi:hypothetical protein
MSKNMDSARRAAEKPAGSSERLADPPLSSAWNFQNKERDWHEDFYDEIPLSTSRGAVKHVLFNRDELSWIDRGH